MTKLNYKLSLLGEPIWYEEEVSHELANGIEVPYEVFNCMWNTVLSLQKERSDIKGIVLSTILKHPFAHPSLVSMKLLRVRKTIHLKTENLVYDR